MELLIKRPDYQPERAATLGEFFLNGSLLGYTCEDEDRRLETGGEKVHGKTAIPRGRYRVVMSMSTRFKRVMPEVLDVPGFHGIRIHGGNTVEDTEGCPLLGAERTSAGVANCSGVNSMLRSLLTMALAQKEDCWLEVS